MKWTAHHMILADGTVYADTSFMGAMRMVNPQWDLTHMGWGEFYLADCGEGRADFAREDTFGSGVEIPGATGRTHRFYDNVDGRLVAKIVAALEEADASVRVEGSTRRNMASLTRAQKRVLAVLRLPDTNAWSPRSSRMAYVCYPPFMDRDPITVRVSTLEALQHLGVIVFTGDGIGDATWDLAPEEQKKEAE